MKMIRSLSALVISLWVLGPPLLRAEPVEVRPVAYQGLEVKPVTATVRFEKRAARQGDRVDQSMRVALSLSSSTRQGEQATKSAERKRERYQQRTLLVDEVTEGQAMAVRVRFQQSQRAIDDAEPEVHPIVGKTYSCRRTSDGLLHVTRDDGSLPNPEEFAIVSESMESLGKPNPLAEFFAGRILSVGEKVELPTEVGDTLLGSGGYLGKVSRFELTLLEVSQRREGRVARFSVDIESQGKEGAQLRLAISGTLEIDADTCRTRQVDLSGPLAMAKTTGSYSQARITQIRGQLSVAMSATYTER